MAILTSDRKSVILLTKAKNGGLFSRRFGSKIEARDFAKSNNMPLVERENNQTRYMTFQNIHKVL